MEKHLPFIGTEALAAGAVSRRALAKHTMVYRNVYLPNDVELTPVRRAMAAWLWARREPTLAGLSAAAMHGSSWIDPELPAELIRTEARPPEGIVIHRYRLCDEEVTTIDGIPVTTAARTAFDLGRRDTLTTAIIRVDALANATGLKAVDVGCVAERHRGARGIVQLRRVVDLMDGGAESPQETRTRLLLIAAGFPRPQTQIVVCNEFGDFIGRVDMGFHGVEGRHRIRRAAALDQPGYSSPRHRSTRRFGSPGLDDHSRQPRHSAIPAARFPRACPRGDAGRGLAGVGRNPPRRPSRRPHLGTNVESCHAKSPKACG